MIYRVETVTNADNNPTYQSAGFIDAGDMIDCAVALQEAKNFPLPLRFEWQQTDKSQADFPSVAVSHGLFSQTAMELLEAELKGSGDLFPVDVEGKRYWLFRCLNVVDGIDLERSEVILNRYIKTAVLTRDQWPSFFTLPQERQSLFVNEATKQAIESAGLTGFDFQPLGD